MMFSQRTLYVDDFNTIIGSPSKEDKLLLFAKKNNFKTLILYQLNKVDKRWSLTDPRENTVLSEFTEAFPEVGCAPSTKSPITFTSDYADRFFNYNPFGIS